MKHLKSCAKKNRLDDETVRTLVQRELERISTADKKEKGKERATEQEGSQVKMSETIFEDLIGEVQSKKRSRKAKAQSTVVTPAEQRGAIINRAQAVVG